MLDKPFVFFYSSMVLRRVWKLTSMPMEII
ncbi:hypothetical protein TELCIR_12403 [Teladorsagia circumcincta]|uniref:Uncharacterized protein n=1 Tax=Teladorsagia circumcincta TaxID=45464 RepID=A0A2G9U880_TELCI|nr:hypothetical protein TELCIR_12403 [Teladorsagia circumcincta]